MNIKCTVIEDLLPLYVDGICSTDTKEIVEVHLKECDTCNKKYLNMSCAILNQEKIPEENEQPCDLNLKKEEIVTSFTAKKAFKKLRRRFIVLILCILFLIPNIYLGINQAGGEGICYTNIGVVFKAYSMLTEIKKGNYEKAFTYLDIERSYRELTNPIKTESLDDIYTLITIGGTDYYVKEQIVNYYEQYKQDNDELSFWRNIYLDNDYIIPKDKYDQLLEVNPKISEENTEEDYIDNGNSPVLISSAYGNFYIPYHFKSSSASVNGTEILNQLANIEADILPIKVYETILEQIKKDDAEQERIRQEYIDMGYESYYASYKNNFVDNMKRLSESRIKLSDTNLKGIFRMNEDINEYQLDYDMIFKADGTIVKGFGLTIMATEGKINFGGSYTETNSKGEKLSEQYNLTSAFNISGQ
jgi:hypothetical protein